MRNRRCELTNSRIEVVVEWFSAEIALNYTCTSKSSKLQAQLLVFSGGIGIDIPSDWLRTSAGIRGQSAAGF
jgi:hypothetical protein